MSAGSVEAAGLCSLLGCMQDAHLACMRLSSATKGSADLRGTAHAQRHRSSTVSILCGSNLIWRVNTAVKRQVAGQ